MIGQVDLRRSTWLVLGAFVLSALVLSACGSASGGHDGGGNDDPDGSVASSDGGNDPDGGGDADPDGGGDTPSGFRRIPLLDFDERVTGIYCTGPHSCVIATEPFGDAGHVYATDGHTITRTILTGDSELAARLGTLGEVAFLGFSKVDDRLVARVNGQEASFVSASGDPTQTASWSAVRIGTPTGAEFGLNAQYALETNGDRWVLVSAGRIFESTDNPGTGAAWTNIWSPQAVPPIPADIDARRAADPTLCNTDPSVSISPALLQPAYVHPDLSLIVTPAGAVNQDGDDTPGVCISTDGGRLFRHVEFPSIEMGSGPVGVTCTSADHCVAYGGVPFRSDSVFVFVTNDASLGASSTWTRATLPTLVEDTLLRSAFFAPDGTHGWIVGAAGPGAPLFLATADGGATWTDATAMIRALAPDVRLHSGYAFDATHIWIGGEHDVLLTIGD